VSSGGEKDSGGEAELQEQRFANARNLRLKRARFQYSMDLHHHHPAFTKER
jgi:hypothetical protein